MFYVLNTRTLLSRFGGASFRSSFRSQTRNFASVVYLWGNTDDETKKYQIQKIVMALKDSYLLPAAADMHVHLRNAPGPISALVTPTIRPAGVDTVFVMPNLAPRPVVTVDEALEYKKALQALDPEVNYLMSLYLHDSITPDEIRKAKQAGIAGVKAYPKGATTNSQWGVVSFDPFHDVLKTMEEEGVVLNLHGEVPSSPAEGVTVMNAESKFLPTLTNLVHKYPKLKIVLEHCTTADGVAAVRSFGDNVVGTIV